MIYYSIIFCIIMCIIGKLTEKKVINPITVFYGIWLTILYLYSLKLYRLIPTTNKIINFIFIGLIFYSIGYYTYKVLMSKKTIIFKYGNFKFGIQENTNYTLKSTIVFSLCYFVILFLIIRCITTLKYLFSGNTLAYIREYAQETTSVETGIISAIRSIIVNPFIMALQPIIACEIWNGKNKNKKLIFLDIIILLLTTLAEGSRANFIYLLFFVFIIYNIKYTKIIKFQKKIFVDEKIKKRVRKILLYIIIIGCFLIIITTLSRSGNNTIRYAYYYFSMEPHMFEIWAEKVEEADLHGYGLASTNGFSFFIFYFLKNLKILSNYPSYWHKINLMIANTVSEWQIITSGATTANAYVSLFWYFYLDGRIAGIMMGSFLYGFIGAKYYKIALYNMSDRTLSMYSFILQGIAMSFVRFQFANMTYAIAFLLLLLLFRKNKDRRIE